MARMRPKPAVEKEMRDKKQQSKGTPSALASFLAKGTTRKDSTRSRIPFRPQFSLR